MKQKIDFMLERILIFIMAVMVINVLWQVISRYVFNDPSNFTDELAGFLLIWVGLLGSGYATGQKLHMAIDLFPASLQGSKKTLVLKIIHGFTMLFAVLVMVIGGGQLVLVTLQLKQLSSALQIPMGYVYAVVPLSGLVMTYYSLYFLIKGEGYGHN